MRQIDEGESVKAVLAPVRPAGKRKQSADFSETPARRLYSARERGLLNSEMFMYLWLLEGKPL
jgi:hypothetical protein